MDQISIYDKYGGYDFFHRCIYGLYLSMFEHPEISYHFVGVDIERLSKHQTQFLVRAIGGPELYQGGLIKNVHQHMQITSYEFKEISKAFKDVFIHNGVESADVEFIMNFITSHQFDVVTAKTNPVDKFMKTIYRIFDKIRKLLRF
jgi:hemoglobin